VRDPHDSNMDRSLLEDMLERAKKAFTIHDYDKAELLARQLVARVPRSVAPRILLGTIYSTTERYPIAEEEFKKALASDPVNIEALNNLGVLYRLQGRLEEAEHALKKALQQTGGRADIHYNLGNVYKQRDDVEEAIEQYKHAVRMDKTFVLAYNNLGTLFEQQEKYEEAIGTFKEGLKYDPNHPTLQYNLGIAYQHTNRLDEAEKAFTAASRAKPGWVDALNNLGVVLQRKERYDESVQVFKEILAFEPESATAHNNIATTLAKQGQVSEAINYYRKALEQNPGYERAAVNLSQVLDKAQSSEAVSIELLTLVEKNPQNIDLRIQLAKSYQKINRINDAEQQLLAAQRIDDKNAEVIRALALLYFQQGNTSESEKFFAQLRTLAPDDIGYRLDIARLLQSQHKLSEALVEVKDFLSSKPDNLEAIDLYGSLLIEAGRYDDAVAFLNEKKKHFPDEASIVGLLSEAFQKLGQKDNALKAADELISIQGRRASPDDINSLNESLELYEQAVAAFSDEHGSAWQKSLERLAGLHLGRVDGPADNILLNDRAKEAEADSIPILELGSFEYEFADEDIVDLPDPPPEPEEDKEPELERVMQQMGDMAPSLMSMIDDVGAAVTPPPRLAAPNPPQLSAPEQEPREERPPQPMRQQQPPQYQYPEPIRPPEYPQASTPQIPQQQPLPQQPRSVAPQPIQAPEPQAQPAPNYQSQEPDMAPEPPFNPEPKPAKDPKKRQNNEEPPYSPEPGPKPAVDIEPPFREPEETKPEEPEAKDDWPTPPVQEQPLPDEEAEPKEDEIIPPIEEEEPQEVFPEGIDDDPLTFEDVLDEIPDEALDLPEEDNSSVDELLESNDDLIPDGIDIEEGVPEFEIPEDLEKQVEDMDEVTLDPTSEELDAEPIPFEEPDEDEVAVFDEADDDDTAVDDALSSNGEMTIQPEAEGYESVPEPENLLPDEAEVSLGEEMFPPEQGQDEPEESGIDGEAPSQKVPQDELALDVIPEHNEWPEPFPIDESLVKPGTLHDWYEQDDPLESQVKPELPKKKRSVDTSPPAQARLFDYLLGMTKSLPGHLSSKVEGDGIPEKLERIKKYFEGGVDQFGREKGTTFVERARRKGPRGLYEAATAIRAATKPEIPAGVDTVSETFGTIGKLSKLLPQEQLDPLRNKMRRLLDVMEQYRTQG